MATMPKLIAYYNRVTATKEMKIPVAVWLKGCAPEVVGESQAFDVLYSIEDLDLRKQRALSIYHMSIVAKLATLDEQARIAREIDQSHRSFSAQAYTNGTTVMPPLLKMTRFIYGVIRR